VSDDATPEFEHAAFEHAEFDDAGLDTSDVDGSEVDAPALDQLPVAPLLPLLTIPEGGVPPLIDTPEALREAAVRFAQGRGPVAADAERASGFRYGQATYLAQFKRAGAGIALIDAGILTDLSVFSEALGDAEWVFHAASQDLPGMRDLGMSPASIFDTELAARMLGWPKVGLAAVVEQELGFTLAKEHSAQDWSTRPLPDSWLAYAALDVEVLLDLRDRIAEQLEATGKMEWARQEFAAVLAAGPADPKVDPWRRTSGTHAIRDQRSLAIVRALWETRDLEARKRDISPGRILRDAAITAAAQAKPETLEALLSIREWQSSGTKRRAPAYFPAIRSALNLPTEELPDRRGPSGDGPPPPRVWKEKHPIAIARLEAAREFVADLAERHSMPAEQLLQPESLRRACWEYTSGGEDWVREFLAARGARQWQIDVMAPSLARAFEIADEAFAAAP